MFDYVFMMLIIFKCRIIRYVKKKVWVSDLRKRNRFLKKINDK